MSAFHDLSSKLRDALEGDSHSHSVEAATNTSGTIAPPEDGEASDNLKYDERGQKKEGWSERIKDVLDGEDGKKKRELEEEEERLRLAKLELDKKIAKEKVDEERGFMGKVHDVFDGGAERKAEEEAAAAEVQRAYEAEKRAHEHLGDKLEDVIKEHKNEFKEKLEEIRNPHREKAEKGEIRKEDEHRTEHKIEQLWHHAPEGEKKAQAEHGKDFNLLKIKEVLTGEKTEEKKKSQRGWLEEKMNSMAGGGRRGEVNEDGLDKMIDFIQEHALHQGDQSDESAAEQFKDKRIADAIRTSYQQVTGHQFPIKDKN